MTALPLDLRQWETSAPEAWEEYRERASIREILGRMPRARAEAAAEEDVRRSWAAGGSAALVDALGRNVPRACPTPSQPRGFRSTR